MNHEQMQKVRDAITGDQRKRGMYDLRTEALRILDAALAQPEPQPESDEPDDVLAGRLIDTWCEENKKPIPWQKAVEIISIVKKLGDAERLRLLGLDDDDPLAPIAQLVLENAGAPFNSIAVRTHFFKEVPPPGTLLFTAPVPAPQREWVGLGGDKSIEEMIVDGGFWDCLVDDLEPLEGYQSMSAEQDAKNTLVRLARSIDAALRTKNEVKP